MEKATLSCVQRVIFVLLSTYLSKGSAQQIHNVTIDDQTGDAVTKALPTYFPSGSTDFWLQGAENKACVLCPDPAQAVGGTWHDATSTPDKPRSFSATFVGSAVYVYFILPNTSNDTDPTNVSFQLDGETAGTFAHTPNPALQSFQYNVPVFIKMGLENTSHSLLVSMSPTQQTNILFDYIIYS
ncbi:uncharacterized protein FOMMEDRAFT_92687 [Fomitiporia mediterranea MF3/22]|uniref:uncharacterized protein n=1 Tax=Fomitiporia mediterranea (strain MF3/22) TaxID=694068 RepID=UPI0004408353|nr:uncharacterized protein FOMMEDRAFT_92687 [Fomitiporia mediterranea MF3/22]EJD00020.1 hypothetical protein FOMMEDRAFT_92687 [Fomitiporia mediterranea MF3/22]